MLVSIIAIGNSKGIRIPKSIIDQLNISDQIEMEVENQQIILKPIKEKPRSGWESAFKEMHDVEDDFLLIPGINENEDFQWEW